MARLVYPVVFLVWGVAYIYFILYREYQENMQIKEEGGLPWLPDLSYTPHTHFIPL